ncbi:ParB family protein [Vibrio vulnificus]|uniref:ParB family protein n=1 Tax=Vibrio vulnificus TaxID=672 RepID=UPI00355ED0B3
MRFFVDRVQEKFVNVQAEQPLDETKLDIIAAIKAELKITEAKQVKEQAEVTPLAQFNSKGVFARKRVKGRNFSYEFGRLSKDVQNELDQAIAAVLEKYQGS